MKLSIVIPVRNEHDTVVQLIDRVRAVDCGMPKELIVVDGASTDGTRDALLALGESDELALVLEDRARGKGRAVRTGFERATGDIVMVQDADLELDPSEIPALLAPIVEGRTHVVFGSRFKATGRARAPLVGYTGNFALTTVTNVLYRAHLTDILTCYKVMRREVAAGLDLQCNGFDLDAEIACRLLRDGYDILEVPVTYDPRSADEGKKLSPGVGWSVLRAILRVRFSRAHVRAAGDRVAARPFATTAADRDDDR
ncbi:MAG TPA: glycosyltransferase family 2 protein [Dehalococcoidia bacterium]|jgi:glycosyltransferase involved in cell wall biosynthesis|nr:glycosyltransferase family 2 protein [Dehalococcoidia bacterium]